ncbi:MAG: LUD domain-containing protein [Desulfobacteraceae bacterium]|nr:LUD domain-containing protein [Desulfobacteraceae bacterium]
MEQTELMDRMKEKAGLVQALVSTVTGMEEVLGRTVGITLGQGGKTIVAPGLDPENLQRLEDLCRAAGLTVLYPPFRPHLSAIHTALTPADWAIAETGTLVLDSDSEDLRIATMLSETHVAWIPVSRIVPDAAALSARLIKKMKSGPGYLAFITGPSRTADIERVLAIGVHGPQELHILMMEEP